RAGQGLRRCQPACPLYRVGGDGLAAGRHPDRVRRRGRRRLRQGDVRATAGPSMNREFLDNIEQELKFFYEHAREYAEEFPGIADRLGGLAENNMDPGLQAL